MLILQYIRSPPSAPGPTNPPQAPATPHQSSPGPNSPIPLPIIKPPTPTTAPPPRAGSAPGGGVLTPSLSPSPAASSVYLSGPSSSNLTPISPLPLSLNQARPATPSSQPVEVVIGQVLTSMQSFKAKQWKYTDKKTREVVVVSQRLDDVLGRIRQYSNVGNILVSSDPTIAALAWGGFNLLLQVYRQSACLEQKNMYG